MKAGRRTVCYSSRRWGSGTRAEICARHSIGKTKFFALVKAGEIRKKETKK